MAVLNPNVRTVDSRSLSIVFGTPMTRRPLCLQLACDAKAAVPSDCDERVGTIEFFDGAIRLFRRAAERIASVGCAQDRPAQVRDFAHRQTPKFRTPDTHPWETIQNHPNAEADDAISFAL